MINLFIFKILIYIYSNYFSCRLSIDCLLCLSSNDFSCCLSFDCTLYTLSIELNSYIEYGFNEFGCDTEYGSIYDVPNVSLFEQCFHILQKSEIIQDGYLQIR